MKAKNFAKLSMLSIVAVSCLFTLSAWSKKPVNYTKCKKEGKTDQRCEKETREDNLYTFGAELSVPVFPLFNDFTAAQKDQAMDYADGNRMSPDKAVQKVAGSNKRY
jgi:hypothetical protein